MELLISVTSKVCSPGTVPEHFFNSESGFRLAGLREVRIKLNESLDCSCKTANEPLASGSKELPKEMIVRYLARLHIFQYCRKLQSRLHFAITLRSFLVSNLLKRSTPHEQRVISTDSATRLPSDRQTSCHILCRIFLHLNFAFYALQGFPFCFRTFRYHTIL